MNLVTIDSNNIVSVDRCQYEDHMQTNINVIGNYKVLNDGNVEYGSKYVKNIIVFKDDDSLKAFYKQLTNYMHSNNLI